MSRPTGPSHRREQIGAELHRVLQELLARGLNDPRLQGLVTLTEVRVSPDLAQATVMVSVMPEKNGARVVAALRHAAGHLRREAGKAIQTVRIPDMLFELDDRLKKQAAVFEALGRVAAEREAGEAMAANASDATGENSGGGVDSGARSANNPLAPSSPPTSHATESPWTRRPPFTTPTSPAAAPTPTSPASPSDPR